MSCFKFLSRLYKSDVQHSGSSIKFLAQFFFIRVWLTQAQTGICLNTVINSQLNPPLNFVEEIFFLTYSIAVNCLIFFEYLAIQNTF